MPDNGINSRGVVESLVTLRFDVAEPRAVGANVMETVQLPPAVIVAALPRGQSPETILNGPSASKARTDIVTGPVPVLVAVMVFAALVTPTAVSGNVRDVGENARVRVGVRPLPDSVTVGAGAVELLSNENVAERGPVALGSNAIVKLTLWPGLSVNARGVSKKKSPERPLPTIGTPFINGVVILIGVFPVLVRVTV